MSKVFDREYFVFAVFYVDMYFKITALLCMLEGFILDNPNYSNWK